MTFKPFLIGREQQIALEKRQMTKKYIEEFKHAQEEWKRKEREAMEEENRRILAFANVQKEREEAQKAEKQARYDNIMTFVLFASYVVLM